MSPNTSLKPAVLPLPFEPASSDPVVGRVVRMDGDRCVVAADAARVYARRAAGCLLVPEVGDRVLVAVRPEPWVLTVLERGGEGRARLEVEGDATLHTRGGGLRLAADTDVEVRAPGRVEVATREATVVAEHGRGHFGELGVVARVCDHVVERLTQRASRVYRFVRDLEQLRAGRVDLRAEQTAQLSAEVTTVSARQVVKVDGEQVHIG